MKFIYEIENFRYNGFFVKSLKGKAKYKGNFIKWTNDPGIILMDCSDGKQREIPSCCILNIQKNPLPIAPVLKPFKGVGLLFGNTSQS